MGGVVRRWIGTNPIPNSHKNPGQPAVGSEIKKINPKLELDPHSTEIIAKQLLDPSVSEGEEAEYQGSVSSLSPFAKSSSLIVVISINAKTSSMLPSTAESAGI